MEKDGQCGHCIIPLGPEQNKNKGSTICTLDLNRDIPLLSFDIELRIWRSTFRPGFTPLLLPSGLFPSLFNLCCAGLLTAN